MNKHQKVSVKNGILSRLREILSDLIKFPEGCHFAQPIDPDRQNLPTYRKIIESPMDFGTIMRNIEANTYKDDIDQAFYDVFLTIDNCFHFNPPENLVSQHCRKIQIRLIKQLRMHPRIPIALIDLLDRTKPTRWWKNGVMKSPQEVFTSDKFILSTGPFPSPTQCLQPLEEDPVPLSLNERTELYKILQTLQPEFIEKVCELLVESSRGEGRIIEGNKVRFELEILHPLSQRHIYNYAKQCMDLQLECLTPIEET
ncbi:hypothetical protein BLNAU_1843 [Blattamonas nauphoetae]|uniref:Bromo domain-containing protein n=1 Tax=Blattamonas nauphoetae TaxID=2049346 RepID=A0ABQ9YHS7_9EUKA|nr:hypothetical protein BLNAU_1843 [Blattamonas nauphoetae]